MKLRQLAHYFGLVAFAVVLSGCALGPPEGVEPVRNFNLERYLGHWYEIARLDHRFERGMSDVSATYRAQENGKVEVINRGFDAAKDDWRQAIGTARFIGEPTQGSLKVSFFGPFYGGYHVIALDPDYRWSVVLGPDPSYAWILARDKTLSPALREQVVQKLTAAGVDASALIWVSHLRDAPSLGQR